MSREDERHLSTADLAGAGQPYPDAMRSPQPREDALDGERSRPGPARPELAALFLGPVADEFRSRWDAIQIGFVDDPREAVRSADELVAQVMKSLAESFAEQRQRIEQGIGQDGQSDTEALRMGLQRYRSFFQRLLSL